MEKKLVVVIPAYEPRENFFDYVVLLSKYAGEIVVVDDGSGEEYSHIFERIATLDKVRVISYAKNRGKGYALKRGIAYCIERCGDEAIIVTADCDGQHTPNDVIRVYEKACEAGDSIVLGVRNFKGKDVPLRSRFGNAVSTGLFALLFRKRISDTQTGLRAFSVSYARALIGVKGERFDYESEVLIYSVRRKIPIYEVPIKTVYDETDGTHTSHFKTVRDSLRVIATLVRGAFLYSISSLLSCAMDLCVFGFLINFRLNGDTIFTILSATVVARIVSSLFNYTVNLKVVFKNGYRLSIVKYYILASLQLSLSSLLLQISANVSQLNITAIKAIIDTILGIISYFVQKSWVFGKSYKRINPARNSEKTSAKNIIHSTGSELGADS